MDDDRPGNHSLCLEEVLGRTVAGKGQRLDPDCPTGSGLGDQQLDHRPTDADGTATQTYSIVAAGTDANSVDHDLFTVASGGVLTFTTAPNYEAAGCGAGNNANVCVVVLRVSDGTNTDDITVTVTITNVVIDITANRAEWRGVSLPN